MGFSPSASIATLRPEIGVLFSEFGPAANRRGFIGPSVLRPLPAMVAAGTQPRIKLASILKTMDLRRNADGSYPRGSFEFDTVSYATIEYGPEFLIDDNWRNRYRNFFDALAVGGELALHQLLIELEKRVAAAVFNTTTWTGSTLTTAVASSGKWTLTATSPDPIGDVLRAKIRVFNNAGFWPNTVIMSRKRFETLRELTPIKNAIQSGGAGFPTRASDITAQQLAEVFGVERVLIAGGAKNTAGEGLTATIGEIWDPAMCMVCRTAVGDGASDILSDGSIGRLIVWSEDAPTVSVSGEEQMILAPETYRDETRRGEVIRHRHQTDEKIYYAQAGHLITGLE